jgi:hypothetical protein
MQEYEYLFSKSLHEKLKETIKASIFCKVIDDILIVDITTKEGIDFGYACTNFSEKLQLKQITQESIVDEICGKFKKKIVNTFFYY